MIQQTDITVEQAYARLRRATRDEKSFTIQFTLRCYPEHNITEWEWEVYTKLNKAERDFCRSPLLRLAVEQMETYLMLDRPITDLMKVDAQIPKTQTLKRTGSKRKAARRAP